MRRALDDASNELADSIGRKNDLYTKLGSTPKVSTDQARDAIFGKQADAKQGGSPAKPLTDPKIALQYLQKAGGDKGKARALAQADGWSF